MTGMEASRKAIEITTQLLDRVDAAGEESAAPAVTQFFRSKSKEELEEIGAIFMQHKTIIDIIISSCVVGVMQRKVRERMQDLEAQS